MKKFHTHSNNFDSSTHKLITNMTKLLIVSFFCITIFAQLALSAPLPVFQSKISAIPIEEQQTMQQYTWHHGCPVSLNELAYLQLSYWGFDNNPHQGILIVNKQIASETVKIFHDLFLIQFPIAKMQPLDVYKGDDEQSMADNNTVAFNCRAMTNHPNYFSLHSYGTAIDINPLLNPYIYNGMVLPPQGVRYLSRNPNIKGIIIKGNAAYTIFIKYGWHWGGNWQNLKDYQHFEKDN